METRPDKHIFICTKNAKSFFPSGVPLLSNRAQNMKQFFFFFEKLIGNECVSSREKNLRVFSWECKRAFNFIYSKLAVPMHLLL